MAYLTQQVERAQAAAKTVGLKRADFRAITDRVYKGTRNGHRMFDYGDLLFFLRGTITQDQVKQVSGIIFQGYDVLVTYYNGKIAHVGMTETRMPSGIGKVEYEYYSANKDEEVRRVRIV